MESLREMLLTACPSIIPFLDWLTRAYDDVSESPRSVKILVKAFAASSSVCGFVHPSETLHTLLNEIVGGLIISQHPSKLELLQEECPLLFNAFSDIEESTFPRSWYPILTDLIKKSSEPFSTASSSSPPPVSSEQPSGHPQEIAFFPNLPIIRSRGVYAADKYRRREDICTKNHPSHSLFLPGLFTIFCPHGINYGFEVMQTRESPNVPFTIFRTRFQNAPKVIVYDNACNLHSYCLNRDPDYFKKKVFGRSFSLEESSR
ncbi:uncharacterized protein LOC114544566 [Dendronephthya gigantea]|uniref:uncharacterized protein LOC114544566 n=1 Tax=Dendronephthya gigantea TaxID=151771 RepID=UPI00106D4C71|nr:uncharacterized protein LOC114544566 [Dendronephthya gigantea]